jgi:hypothetical protein
MVPGRFDPGRPVARKKQIPLTQEDGADAAASPAARQTIDAYERGGHTPSLKQFPDPVEFHALEARAGPTAQAASERRR